jgi:ABC-type oligopeptide transport system substrate-binding subunit
MQAEQLLAEEVPACPLFYQPMHFLIKKNVKTSIGSPFGGFNFSNCFKQ